MPVLSLLRRILHTEPESEPHTAAHAQQADRSALLRELEVSVPAPERIVGWEAARGSQRFSRT